MGQSVTRSSIVIQTGGIRKPGGVSAPLLIDALTDSEKKPLNGSNKYLLHFTKEQMPPVDAFWSLTLYDKDSYLVDIRSTGTRLRIEATTRSMRTVR